MFDIKILLINNRTGSRWCPAYIPYVGNGAAATASWTPRSVSEIGCLARCNVRRYGEVIPVSGRWRGDGPEHIGLKRDKRYYER